VTSRFSSLCSRVRQTLGAGGIPLPTFENLRHDGAMTRYNDKARVRDHYDRVSPYYQTLWGEHLHHGYWIRGDETKETAQVQLIEHLAQTANITSGGKILDAGCGFGGSSIYLAKRYQAEATGITISPFQVEAANQAARKACVNAKFLLMDAEAMEFNTLFDVVWSVESIAHYQDKERFFASATKLLKPSGTLAITDWFKKASLKAGEYEKFLRPIEEGMLVELQTIEEYETLLARNGFKIMKSEILNKNCAKTWDLCLDIIKNKKFWGIAAKNGSEFVHYLKAFRAMRAGFASGRFVYGLIAAKKV
jgi:tocopherol O-methyltransferase